MLHVSCVIQIFVLKEDENIAAGIWVWTVWLVWLLSVSVGGCKPSEQNRTIVGGQIWINMRHIPHELFRNNQQDVTMY
jgi:hypothetical protein